MMEEVEKLKSDKLDNEVNEKKRSLNSLIHESTELQNQDVIALSNSGQSSLDAVRNSIEEELSAISELEKKTAKGNLKTPSGKSSSKNPTPSTDKSNTPDDHDNVIQQQLDLENRRLSLDEKRQDQMDRIISSNQEMMSVMMSTMATMAAAITDSKRPRVEE